MEEFVIDLCQCCAVAAANGEVECDCPESAHPLGILGLQEGPIRSVEVDRETFAVCAGCDSNHYGLKFSAIEEIEM